MEYKIWSEDLRYWQYWPPMTQIIICFNSISRLLDYDDHGAWWHARYHLHDLHTDIPSRTWTNLACVIMIEGPHCFHFNPNSNAPNSPTLNIEYTPPINFNILKLFAPPLNYSTLFICSYILNVISDSLLLLLKRWGIKLLDGATWNMRRVDLVLVWLAT